jgi:gamma-glutamyltranspeptidase/glutathione hydrolase
MSPTLVFKGDRPIMSLGAAGGPTIISQVVQVLNNNLRLAMPLSDAVAAPRIHHQWRPDALYLEKTIAGADRAALLGLGHTLKTLGPYGSTQAIGLNAKGHFVAVAEPRLLERNRVKNTGAKKPVPEANYIDVKTPAKK